MISLLSLYNEIKLYGKNSLKNQGYMYYEKVNEWIKWVEWQNPKYYDETGVVFGENPQGKEFVGNYFFGDKDPRKVFDIEEY